ncbi:MULTISPECIES: TrkH family potassium uptake protein [unclassified Modicisalibacter]|uniref:TrkH family potassium uptake protein n=1 Tax=unclassified Modicisalibacter TaxID=2679913 RepID=UPI001CCF8F86|nr:MULTISPECIES: TrkH family potassium uptake protein [unclassified Modicisalibacter]MBZ9557140.1 TrkH family potassium uptake protein [Modicisalibacter sp. R2A 31.J]MBZ9574146.1 TrkH family potassium uptake protein [Modicisalibacter sp. MOD 31.J]
MRYRQRIAHPLRQLPHGRIIQLSPPEILLLGFALLSGIGTLLLWLPMSASDPLSWHEALFTATSAVTVTGLSVVKAADLTLFGQWVLLCLIQVGGLGFMTFAALTLALMGMRLPLYQRNLVKESLNHTSFGELMSLVRLVIAFALIAEAIGTALLALSWVPQYGLQRGLWVSFFHAVSAFNNAGFSVWPDSLTDHVANPLINVVVSALFIVGGLGFTVIGELLEWRRGRSLSLHARIVLHATLWLSLAGMAAMLLLEWDNSATLGALDGLGAKLQAAWFQAVTPRTAGFNTLDTGSLTDPMTLLTMLLMFIGAGSGSTASGIKVTTFVVLLLVARAFLRSNAQPVVFGRSIPQETVIKAVAVALAGMLLIFTCLFVLTMTEPGKPFLDLAFETVSAFGTVGLSRGVTGELSMPGQLALIVTMLLGRVGPLSLGYFMAARRQRGLKYARGSVQIG